MGGDNEQLSIFPMEMVNNACYTKIKEHPTRL